jgi:hypothetical protein
MTAFEVWLWGTSLKVRSRSALLAAMGTALLLATAPARAEAPCNEEMVRDRQAKLLEAFHTPQIRAKMDAAKKDLEEDGDFDNQKDAKYFIAAAVWHDIDMNLHASAEAACEVMMKHESTIKAVLDEAGSL